jgi:hypothetical protein
MNEDRFVVKRLPEGAANPIPHVVDQRGVRWRATEAEVWLWAELVKAREQAAALQEKRKGRDAGPLGR